MIMRRGRRPAIRSIPFHPRGSARPTVNNSSAARIHVSGKIKSATGEARSQQDKLFNLYFLDEPLNGPASNPFEPWDSAFCLIGSGSKMVQPAGEAQSDALRLDFDRAYGPALLRRLQLSSGKLDDAAPRRGQGRMAPWRTLTPRRLYRRQPVAIGGARRRLLQQARDMRAMDQRGQERDQVDVAVMPLVHRQCGAPSVACAGLQSR